MLSLTRKSDYALVALASLALRRGLSEEAVSARKIADQYNLPLPLLMNILKELTRAGIVTSTRGQYGGYSLAVEPDQITLMRILTAIEGPPRLTPCMSRCDDQEATGAGANSDHTDAQCPRMGDCPVHHAIHRLHHRLGDFLEQVTLADLVTSQVDVPASRVGMLVRS